MLLRLWRLLRMAGRDLLVLWQVFRHPRAPRALKLAVMLTGLYVISPVDLLPDWLAFLGWADDVTLLALVVPVLLRMAPPAVLADAQAAVARGRWRMPA